VVELHVGDRDGRRGDVERARHVCAFTPASTTLARTESVACDVRPFDGVVQNALRVERIRGRKSDALRVPGPCPAAHVDLCTVCLDTVRRANASELPATIRLDSQRILYDTIKWANVNTRPIPFPRKCCHAR